MEHLVKVYFYIGRGKVMHIPLMLAEVYKLPTGSKTLAILGIQSWVESEDHRFTDTISSLRGLSTSFSAM